MSSSIGILAIGSLYWGRGVREAWRQSRLRMQDEISASVPIRYGRLSTTGEQRGTYTMVFSSEPVKLGNAKVLPCANNVASLEDLKTEARLLWAAERKYPQPDVTIASSWGCVVIMRNPNGNADDELIDGWANCVARDIHVRNLARGIEEGRLISERGLLQIPWPNLDSGEAVNLDLLLATANEPTLEGNPPVYPSADTIARAWKQALKERPDDRPDNYFWQNKQNGITTYQDPDIERILNDRSGCLSVFRSIVVF